MVVDSILDQPRRSVTSPVSSQLTVHNNVWFQCDLTKSKSEDSVADSYLSSCDAQWWWSLQIDSKGIQLQTCCGTGNLWFHKSHNEKTGKQINHLQACGQAMQLFRDFTRELKLFLFQIVQFVGSGTFVQWVSGAQLHLVINSPPEVELSSTSIFLFPEES